MSNGMLLLRLGPDGGVWNGEYVSLKGVPDSRRALLGGVANAFCDGGVGVEASASTPSKSFTDVERDSCDGALANAVIDLRPRARDGVSGLCDMRCG